MLGCVKRIHFPFWSIIHSFLLPLISVPSVLLVRHLWVLFALHVYVCCLFNEESGIFPALFDSRTTRDRESSDNVIPAMAMPRSC